MSLISSLSLLSSNSPIEIAHGPREGSADNDQITKVATDFESLFASQILKEMRRTLDPETMFGSDPSDVYGGMFDQFVGQQMSQSGGFGLAKMLRETLQREQQSGRPTIAETGSPASVSLELQLQK